MAFATSKTSDTNYVHKRAALVQLHGEGITFPSDNGLVFAPFISTFISSS